MTVSGVLYDCFIPLPPKVVKETAHHNNYDIKLDEKTKNQVTTDTESEVVEYHTTKRKLKRRMIYLIAFSGVIGTAIFISLQNGLYKGGPLSLLLGFMIWIIPIFAITATVAEMVTYLPIASPFITLAGRCCDDAFEIMAGWNFWFLEAALIPYEVVGVNTIIHFWRNDYSAAIPLVIQVFLYFCINVFAVSFYGEIEFWLSIGKIILAIGLMVFTFVTMVGGNPQRDVYGFRNWTIPGPMNEYISTGDWGRFLGFFSCLIQACFTVAGPEYVAMTAAEAINPRVNMKTAFKTVFYRLAIIFVGIVLCTGIVCSSRDPSLIDAITNGRPGAGASAFVIAMNNMKISTLPDIVNAALITSAFSSGNSYTYCSSRTLYGLAKVGHAPKIFAYCTKTGVPMYAVLVSLAWSFLSFLQLGNSSAKVLNWIVNLITTSQLINYCVSCTTYIFFFKAMKVQGIDRRTLPYRGYFQPYTAMFGLTCAFIMVFLSGYTVFLPGWWNVETFLFSYIMIFIDISIFIGWKLLKRTKWKKSEEVDLTTGLDEIEEYEKEYYALLDERKRNAPPKKPFCWYNPLAYFKRLFRWFSED
ncbi:uncharacterized protein ASCRUDRAFT_74344 [Ascoidea rubescens DSM 1968]|uniref:Amino acid permease/ SLC12A domain-containing protein n=1 Tax=Ascoidea rubescens DSM 1968 TaxID=1344418 RepID=A0A1D2VMP7_9ASCO|nr:hypothetical protein ASCRUDRAFT_74344 [Ascoidea rubescens DSM 1968]ODV62888.1 hypothetical protein ASCRUDRAFT_74344 [Ascoidea rubescens DSM 1968]